MKLKGKLTAACSLVFMVFGVITTTTPALASGGTGGGDDISPGLNPGVWYKLYGNPAKKEAWNRFAAYSGYTPASLVQRVNEAGSYMGNPKLLTQCQNSRYIWHVGPSDPGASSYMWYRNGIYTNTMSWVGGNPPANDWNDFMKYGKSGWNSGHTTLVCSGSYEAVVKDCSRDESNTSKSNGTSFNGIYSVNSKLNSVNTQESLKYTADERKLWDAKHHPQATVEVKTEFGKWYDKNIKAIKNLGNLKGDAFTKVRARLEKEGRAAAAKGAPVTSVKLDKGNKQGFAEGGTYSMASGERKAKVSLGGKTVVKKRHITCKATLNENGQWSKKESAGAWKVASETNTGTNNATYTSPITNKFWQILNARCNQNGVSNVQGAVANSAFTSNDQNSAAIKTKVYGSQADLVLGSPTAKEQVVKDTAYDSFYNENKGCSTPDIIDPPVTPDNGFGIDCLSLASGALANSDAKANIQAKNSENGKYGAQSSSNTGKDSVLLSSDLFSFFRDNKKNDIRLDVWYPKSSNKDLVVNSTKAENSMFAMDPKGTPSFDFAKINIGGKDMTSTPSILNGEVNKITASSKWASDTNKQHQLNGVWKYDATLKVVSPSALNSDGTTSGTEVKNTNIKVYCPLTMNTTDSQKPYVLTTNDIWKPEASLKFKDVANRKVGINFVRATGEVN